ncbi:hypothetical protein AVEN_56764-1 [Araneus ventricosus]|uniref:Uncharacterized protein n=1 Tax=Araneus ventricosus TaxID=182803 RepID=A0A4Y2EW88_ARAVE|nr:hypothetical protein AVEN_56764-1 [Araneus ventricosus]
MPAQVSPSSIDRSSKLRGTSPAPLPQHRPSPSAPASIQPLCPSLDPAPLQEERPSIGTEATQPFSCPPGKRNPAF